MFINVNHLPEGISMYACAPGCVIFLIIFLCLWRMSFTGCMQLKFFPFILNDFKEWSMLQNALDALAF